MTPAPQSDGPEETGLQRVEHAVERNRLFQQVAERYTKTPAIRAAVQVAGIFFQPAAAIDAGLAATLDRMQAERLNVFFEELLAGKVEFTEELVREEGFLLPYFATIQAATRTRQKEKVALFGRLLANAYRVGQLATDAYEEYLEILDSLSVRELEILLLLKELEDANPPRPADSPDGAENGLQRATRIWPEFEASVRQKLDIEPGLLRSMLARTARTGLYEVFYGAFLGYEGGKGTLTPLFAGFSEWLTSRSS